MRTCCIVVLPSRWFTRVWHRRIWTVSLPVRLRVRILFPCRKIVARCRRRRILLFVVSWSRRVLRIILVTYCTSPLVGRSSGLARWVPRRTRLRLRLLMSCRLIRIWLLVSRLRSLLMRLRKRLILSRLLLSTGRRMLLGGARIVLLLRMRVEPRLILVWMCRPLFFRRLKMVLGSCLIRLSRGTWGRILFWKSICCTRIVLLRMKLILWFRGIGLLFTCSWKWFRSWNCRRKRGIRVPVIRRGR